MLSLSLARRAWNGVSVDISEFHCAGRVVHPLRHQTETRLSVVLEEVGGHCEPRLREDQLQRLESLVRGWTPVQRQHLSDAVTQLLNHHGSQLDSLPEIVTAFKEPV